MNRFSNIRRILSKGKHKFKSLFYDKKERRHNLVGDPTSWKMKQQFQIDFLKKVGLKTSDILLDIGCGTLRGGIPIIQYLDEKKYFGIDIRKNVLEEARKELKEENLEHKKPNLIHFEDFSSLNMDTKFDFMFAFSVLIHFEDAILDKCLKFVSENLKENGFFYANVNIGDTPEGTWLEFPMVTRSFEFYAGVAEKYGLEVSDIGNIGEYGHASEVKEQNEQRMLKFQLNR